MPKQVIPKFFVWLLGPMLNKGLTRKVVSRNMGKKWCSDNNKIKNELGITFRPMQESINDMFQQLIDSDQIKQ